MVNGATHSQLAIHHSPFTIRKTVREDLADAVGGDVVVFAEGDGLAGGEAGGDDG